MKVKKLNFLQRSNEQQFAQGVTKNILLAEQGRTAPSIKESLVGIISDSGFDKDDYKQYLEEKYR